MGDVFISYRRAPASYIARAIFQDLRAHGYDAFLDVQSIDSGVFTTVIDRQIRTRRHFVLVLTPGTLDRCAQLEDMVRHEIRTALEADRNIIPFATDTFDWGDITRFLPPEMHRLGLFNSVPKVSHEWFEAAMERLRTRHLKEPEYARPEPDENEAYASEQVPEIPRVTPDDLTAEALAQQAVAQRQAERYAQALALLEQALALRPDYASAWLQRGLVRMAQNQDAEAIPDLTQALQLDARLVDAWAGRALAHLVTGRGAEAEHDLAAALAIAPDDAGALFIRASLHRLMGRTSDAIADMERVLAVNPTYPSARQALDEMRASRPRRGWFG
jgi:tetratricopeptide (TPR) repeat protein